MGPGADGRGEIVLQNGPHIHLLDLKTGKTRAVDITIPGDRPALREHLVDYSEFLQSYNISAKGERAVVQARGDVWTLPAEKGITRNLTRTSGVAEISVRSTPAVSARQIPAPCATITTLPATSRSL